MKGDLYSIGMTTNKCIISLSLSLSLSHTHKHTFSVSLFLPVFSYWLLFQETLLDKDGLNSLNFVG